MQDYLDWKRSTTKNPATVYMYELWVRRYLTFLKGDDITLESIGRFREFLKVQPPIGMGFSPKNIQYGCQLIRDYISYQNTVHNLNFPLKLLKIPQERSNSHPAITREEFYSILALLPKNEPQALQRRLMLMMLWDSGMRIGELLRLRISDLHDKKAIIHNEKNHRNRRIGWSQETEDLLQFYLPLRKELPTKDNEDYVFVSFKYRPCRKFTTRHLQRVVEELRRAAKIEVPITPHSFRHGFVHRKLHEGKSVPEIAQMVGHSTIIHVMTYSQMSGPEIELAWKM